MYCHDQKALEGKPIPRDALGLAALDAASWFAATIRAVEIERCFHGPVSTIAYYAVGWFVAFRKGLGGEKNSADETP